MAQTWAAINHKSVKNFLIESVVKVSVVSEWHNFATPMDCSPPGSSVQGILQARILGWVAIPFSRGSSPPKDKTLVSCIAGWFFYHLSHQGSPSVMPPNKTQFSTFRSYFFSSGQFGLPAKGPRVVFPFPWTGALVQAGTSCASLPPQRVQTNVGESLLVLGSPDYWLIILVFGNV